MYNVNQNSIFEYGDYRAFIGDFYAKQKIKRVSFSLSTLAKKVGMSKVAVKYVIDKRRHIADDNIGVFARALNLKGADSHYFASLVLFNKAKTTKLRNQHFKAMLRLKGSPLQDQYLDGSNVGYFQAWFYPAIAELSFVQGFQKDPDWIRKRLYFKIPQEKISKALSYLESHGYLQGSAIAHRRVKTAAETSSHVGQQFLIGQMDLGRAALETQSQADREVFALTISLDHRKFQLAKEMLAEFRHQLHDLLATTEPTAERVVQINMQMFTLARPGDQTP